MEQGATVLNAAHTYSTTCTRHVLPLKSQAFRAKRDQESCAAIFCTASEMLGDWTGCKVHRLMDTLANGKFVTCKLSVQKCWVAIKALLNSSLHWHCSTFMCLLSLWTSSTLSIVLIISHISFCMQKQTLLTGVFRSPARKQRTCIPFCSTLLFSSRSLTLSWLEDKKMCHKLCCRTHANTFSGCFLCAWSSSHVIASCFDGSSGGLL